MAGEAAIDQTEIVQTNLAQHILDWVVKIMYYVSAVALFSMMLLVALDVGLRSLFKLPILGSVELTEFLMLALVFFGMAYTQKKKGHVMVEAVIERFNFRTQSVFKCITTVVAIVVFFLISWQSVIRANVLSNGNYISPVWHIPTAPFVYFAVLGAAVICILLAIELVGTYKKMVRGLSGKTIAGLTLLILLILVALFIPIWGQTLFVKISPLLAGGIFTIFLIIVMFSGMSVGVVLAFVGFLGTAYITGIMPALAVIGVMPNTTGASYGNSVIPLFILMGAFCFQSNISQDLYDSMYKWLGRLPGGLAMATIAACAGFAAVSGSGAANAATMGAVAVPAMRKFKYHVGLITGSIAAGGGLGILIPPSIPMVIYGILTETSIGKLFLAGFIPGIIEAIFYIITIFIICKRNPLYGPPGPSVPFKEKVVSLKNTWTIVLLFILVIGGMYMGVFTPTEAAGIGAFIALVIALARRKLGWSGFGKSLAETGSMTGMIFLLIIGGTLFGHLLSVSRLPFELSSLVQGLALNRWFILIIIIFIYLFLGCIMSSLAMIIITVPIFFPIVMSLGFDPIWFGIIIVRLVEIGAITPPVGIHVFILHGIAKDVPMYTIFKGVVPFLIADFFHMALLICVPQIVLFLPNLMH